ALRQLNDATSARQLVNCALGFRAVYVVLDDVRRLAELLVALDAPTALWAEWGAILLQHLQFATKRPHWFDKELHDQGAVEWALGQDAASEQVVREAIAHAPPELMPILQQLSRHSDASSFADVIASRFRAPERSNTFSPAHASWFDADALRL